MKHFGSIVNYTAYIILLNSYKRNCAYTPQCSAINTKMDYLITNINGSSNTLHTNFFLWLLQYFIQIYCLNVRKMSSFIRTQFSQHFQRQNDTCAIRDSAINPNLGYQKFSIKPVT